MHGSHLCHHGLCILPSHLVYEDGTTNLERKSCYTAALNLRSYGAPIPEHCYKHQPPCLLQVQIRICGELSGICFANL